MKKITRIFLPVMCLFAFRKLKAQEEGKVFVTTGAGIIKSPGSLHKVFKPSIAFNSGIELVNKTNWFVQGSFDFHMLKYNQQFKEDGSPYLFVNTTSSLVQMAVSGGKNFQFGHNKWFASIYSGVGYLNIGEPRLIDQSENIIKQEVSREASLFGKAGIRFGYKTKIKLLQTIYFDGAYWTSPLNIQGSKLKGISLFLGARMSMK
jgi:hypothetical protein